MNNKVKLFARKGDTLTLKLNGAKSKINVGNAAACDGENANVEKCVVFRMLRYFPPTQSYLVERARYEGGDHVFVSRRTGSETVMNAILVFSPNAKYLLAFDPDDTGDREYDIAIWFMQSDPLKLEFTYKANQYENWEVTAWADDASY